MPSKIFTVTRASPNQSGSGIRMSVSPESTNSVETWSTKPTTKYTSSPSTSLPKSGTFKVSSSFMVTSRMGSMTG